MEESDQTTAHRYQRFRSGKEFVQIEAFQHPQTSDLVIFWSDIKDCFPGVVRVQHDDLYVPFIRGQEMYRLKPHAIRIHSDTTLNVVYKAKGHDPQQQQQYQMQRNHHHDNANYSAISRSNTPYTKSGDISPHSPHMSAESSVNSDNIEPRTPSVASAKHLPENESFSTPLSPITSSSSLIELRSSSITPETVELNGLPSSTFARPFTTPEPRLLANPLAEREPSQNASQTAPKNRFPMSSAQFRAFLGMAGDKGPKNSKDGETGATVSPAQFRAFLGTSEKETAKASKSMDIKDTKDTRDANDIKEAEGVEDSKGINDAKSHKDADSNVTEENGTDAPAESTQTDAESQDRSLADISTAVSAMATQAGHHWDHPCWDELRGPEYYNTDMFKSVLALQSCHILTKHTTWLENNGPRLFTLLPKPGLDPLLPIERLEYSDFVVQVLCDCVGVKGSQEHCFPHLIADAEFSVFSDGLFTSNITNYLMRVLEVLKFGVVMGEVEHVRPMESPETQARIDRAISYLSLWGVETTIQIIERLASGRRSIRIDPVPLPTKKERDLMYRYFLDDGARMVYSTPSYMTPRGDLRKLCYRHWTEVMPLDRVDEARAFVALKPRENVFHHELGCFRATLSSTSMAKRFYEILKNLPGVPAVSIFLDWDLVQADEADLQAAVSLFKGSNLNIYLRLATGNASSFSGLGHGYVRIVMAALFNRTMDMFMLERMDSIEYGFPDEHYHTHSPVHLGSDACLAAYSRDPMTKAMKVALYVTDSFKAATLIRRAMQGVHHLSEIRMQEGNHADTVKIKFSPEARKLTDKEYNSDPNWIVLAQRGHMDEIMLRMPIAGDSIFLMSGCVRELEIEAYFSMDVARVREAIKINRHLKELKLTIPDDEDPCQIFESFKALFANHAAMKILAIHQTHLQQTHQVRKMPSSYTWKNVSSERKDLELSISFTTGDKVVPLIQKFTPCLTEIEIKDLSQTDSSVLEKAFRPKKGPFKLRRLTLELMSLAEYALEDLKKVILRTPSLTSVFATISTRKTSKQEARQRSADFVMDVNSRITDIFIYGESSPAVLADLESRRQALLAKDVANHKSDAKSEGTVASVSAPAMRIFPELKYLYWSFHDCKVDVRLSEKGAPWLRAILKQCYDTLLRIEIRDVVITDKDWDELLDGHFNLSRLTDFKIAQKNDMSVATMQKIVDAFPEDSSHAHTIILDEPGGVSAEDAKPIRAQLRRKTELRSHRGFIMINRVPH